MFTRLNIETVVLLDNKFSKPKEYVQIGIDAEDYYRIKDAKSDEPSFWRRNPVMSEQFLFTAARDSN